MPLKTSRRRRRRRRRRSSGPNSTSHPSLNIIAPATARPLLFRRTMIVIIHIFLLIPPFNVGIAGHAYPYSPRSIRVPWPPAPARAARDGQMVHSETRPGQDEA